MRGMYLSFLFGIVVKLLTILIGSLLLFGLISSIFKDISTGFLIKPLIQLKMLDFEINLPPNTILVYTNLTKRGVASQEIMEKCVNRTCLCILSFSEIFTSGDGNRLEVRTKYTYPNGTPVNIEIDISKFDYKMSVEGEVILLGETLLGLRHLQDEDYYQKLLFLYSDAECMEVKKIYYLNSSYILAMIINLQKDKPSTLIVDYQDIGGSNNLKNYLLFIRNTGEIIR